MLDVLLITLQYRILVYGGYRERHLHLVAEADEMLNQSIAVAFPWVPDQ